MPLALALALAQAGHSHIMNAKLPANITLSLNEFTRHGGETGPTLMDGASPSTRGRMLT